ncbi:MAG: 50S ribosomal protein L13 [Candidatus Nanoarchaeia archaeon]
MVTIIDGTNLILGRLAANVAKRALQGEEIIIVNCDKVIISGRKESVLKKFKQREARTQPFKGPFAKRMPDRIVKFAIRGMLPHEKWSEESRGRKAFSKIKCFIDVPDEYKNQKFETIPEISLNKLKTPYFTYVGEISKLLRQNG